MSIVRRWELKEQQNGYALVESHHQLGENKLQSLQDLVNGRIEVVNYIDGAVLLMNEEALINGSTMWAIRPEHVLSNLVPEHFTVKGQKVMAGAVILVKDNGENFLGFDSMLEITKLLKQYEPA